MPAIQLAILVLDASGSMREPASGSYGRASGAIEKVEPQPSKAWQIEDMLCRPLPRIHEIAFDTRAALRDCGLIARLQHSQRKDFIDLALIRYHDVAEEYQTRRPIAKWELSPPGTRLSPPEHYMLGGHLFDLVAGMGGTTNITEGLRLANKMKNEWLSFCEQEHPYLEHFVTIILMSDMLHTDGPAHPALQIAMEIKTTELLRGRPKVLLAAAAFGDDADLGLMAQIATPAPANKYALKTSDPVMLREFFLASASSQVGG